MPAAQLTEEQWRQIRTASEQGILDKDLSDIYGVSRESIRQRRKRENWLTPSKVALQTELVQAEQAIRARHAVNAGKASDALASRPAAQASDSGHAITVVTGAPSAARTIAEKLLAIAENNSLRVATLADSALAESPAPEIRSWQDVSTAYKLIRTAAGLDRADQGAQVNVSLAMFAPYQGSERETQGHAWSVHEGD